MISSLSLVWFLLSSSSAMAARAGLVDIEGSEVYQFPDKKSVILIKLHKGTRLVASNISTLGFHRVRLRSSLVGWVSASSLVLQPPPVFTAPVLNSETGNASLPRVPTNDSEIPPPSAPQGDPQSLPQASQEKPPQIVRSVKEAVIPAPAEAKESVEPEAPRGPASIPPKADQGTDIDPPSAP